MADRIYSKDRYASHALEVRLIFTLADDCNGVVNHYIKSRFSALANEQCLSIGATLKTFKVSPDKKKMELLIAYPPKHSVVSIVNRLKRYMARGIKSEELSADPQIEKFVRSSVWKRGYVSLSRNVPLTYSDFSELGLPPFN